MNPIIPKKGESLFELAHRCNAVYICPKVGGERKGSLVTYAAKDKSGHNLVGDIYFNFARIEEHPEAVEIFAESAYTKVSELNLLDTFDTVCGIPHGGRSFGQAFAKVAGKRFTYADRKPKPTQSGNKQEYFWDLSRFNFEQGERVAVAEDVFNNFQNTDHTLVQIQASGAVVVLLVGALNRSPYNNTHYKDLHVVASIREAYPEYEQNDPEVAPDIAAGKLELQVKNNWSKLMAFMQQANS